MDYIAKGYCAPSLHGAGYAKSDFTMCLPAPQRFWGPLGRSEQAAFRGPDFGWIGVLHRPQHRPESPKQAQTRPNGSTYSIVQEAPTLAEIGPIYFGLWCAKNGVANQFSIIRRIEANKPYAVQNSTNWQLLTVFKPVMCLVSNLWLVSEICPFHVWVVVDGSKPEFTLGLHSLIKILTLCKLWVNSV